MKTGKVTFTYKYYPIFQSGESVWAAQAAECANQQDKFWVYHDRLFQVWGGENVGTYSKTKLKQYAVDVGLDTGRFNQCLDGDKSLTVVNADIGDAARRGVNQTPTIFLNNRMLQLTTLDYAWFARTLDTWR